MSKHTLAPWRVEEGTTLIWGACNPEDKSTFGMGYPIAECRITPALYHGKAPYADEGEANARLISAAPEMLEALRDILTRPTDPFARERVRAAIAKASLGAL